MTKVFTEEIPLANTDGIYSETMLNLFWEQGMEHTHTAATLPHSSTEPHDPNLDPCTRKEDEALNGDLKYSKGHPAARSVDANESSLNGDLGSDLAAQVHLEKETWFNAVYLSWGPYGYSLRRKPPASLIGGKPETVSTLPFAPPRLCPTTFSISFGPVPPNAIALTSLHYNVLGIDGDVLRAPIVTALHKLALRRILTIEAFGCSGTTDSVSALTPSSPAPNDGMESLITDFEAQFEEKLNPKPCISNSLAAINRNASDSIRARTLSDSGFWVVTPHPIHPKLHIGLDAELDWDEEIGRALDLSTKESFMRPKLFSLQRWVAQAGHIQTFSPPISCAEL